MTEVDLRSGRPNRIGGGRPARAPAPRAARGGVGGGGSAGGGGGGDRGEEAPAAGAAEGVGVGTAEACFTAIRLVQRSRRRQDSSHFRLPCQKQERMHDR